MAMLDFEDVATSSVLSPSVTQAPPKQVQAAGIQNPTEEQAPDLAVPF